MSKTKPKLNFSKSSQTRVNIRKRALETLWSTGNQIERILDVNQFNMYKAFHDYDTELSSRFLLLCSRRLGKTVLAYAICDEMARNNPGSRILFLSKTTDNIKEILDQATSVYLDSCPLEMKPDLKVKDGKYVYPNGSEIRFKGMDKAGVDAIRGVKAQLVILDEFCFMNDLHRLIRSVIGPMINEQGGRMLLISSSPDTPGHESIDYIMEAEQNGSLIRKTIYDCPRWGEKDIERFAKDAGGRDSDAFRREYMCEIITDRNRAILPSCTEEHIKKVVIPWKKPTDYIPDHYISIDPGGRDQTAILYAYYDYLEGTLVIEDEDIIDSASTEEIHKCINDKLKGAWKGIRPHKIIMDNNNLILVKDMKKLHGLNVKATKKDKKEAQVNNTNLLLAKEELVIDPRCEKLALQCRYGIWNKTRTSYERSAALSHCDAVDALVYLVRNINKSRNPIDVVTHNRETQVRYGGEPESSKGFKGIKQLFKRR